MNAEPPLIELEGIGRRYKGKRGAPVIALRDVSLRLHAGEFVCITGPSGSGKTTLMNILGCLDQPNAGIYRFLGREVQQLSPDGLAWLRRKAFGFVFQNYNLLGSATARENVEMPGTYAGLALVPRRTRALEAFVRPGAGQTHRPPAGSAVRRGAAARFDRARADERRSRNPRRRAHGRAGQRERRAGAGPAGGTRNPGTHHRPGDAQPGDCRPGRPPD